MASTHMNVFDLLGDDESDDVSVLYDVMKKNKLAVEQVPSSTTKPKAVKEYDGRKYTVFADENSQLKYEDEEAHVNENGESKKTNAEQDNKAANVAENGTTSKDGWKAIHKKTQQARPTKRIPNRIDQSADNGSEQAKEEVPVNGDAEVKEPTNGVNGVDVNAGQSDVVSESDAIISTESSNGEEAVGKNTSEINDDVPERSETPEEIKERRIKEKEKDKKRKEWEAEQQKRKQKKADREEESRRKTLAQYEKEFMEKQQNLPKAEARRVVAIDKDLEKMEVVAKKQDNGVIFVKPFQTRPKKGQGLNLEAAKLAQHFLVPNGGAKEPVTYHKSNGGGSNHRVSNDNGRPSTGSPAAKILITETDVPTSEPDVPPTETDIPNEKSDVIYEKEYPVLGFVPPKVAPLPPKAAPEQSKPESESSKPALVQSKPGSQPSKPSTSAVPNRFASSKKSTGPKGAGNPPGSAKNRGNLTSAPGASSSVKTQR